MRLHAVGRLLHTRKLSHTSQPPAGAETLGMMVEGCTTEISHSVPPHRGWPGVPLGPICVSQEY